MRAGYVIETTSVEETEGLGACAGSLAFPGTIFCLRGELGAGKTAFVRGLARGFLHDAGIEVSSPTYVIQHVHRSPKGTLYHMDAYRLRGGAGEFDGAGLGDCLQDASGIVCLEWPERVEDVLPAERVEIEFEHLAPNERRIHILATGPQSGKIVDAMVLAAGNRERLLAWMQKL